MVLNPLFADEDDDKKAPPKDVGYVMPKRHGRTIQPLHDLKPDAPYRPPAHHQSSQPPEVPRATVVEHQPAHHAAHHTKHHEAGEANAAVELIRRKLENLYSAEPNAKEEAAEVAIVEQPQRSKHQQFMYNLSTSGKSLAEIQTAWHDYYTHLPDAEKHQVWQEFYASNNRQASPAAQFSAARHPQSIAAHAEPQHHAAATALQPHFPGLEASSNQAVNPSHVVTTTDAPEPPAKPENRSVKAIKHHVQKRVKMSAASQAKAKQHAKSLFFGLASGAVVLLFVLFGLFNEVVIAPFIQPSRHASATPIILNTDGVAPSGDPQVIIPKISAQLPVDYTQTSSEEETFQKALETGVVHYPTTSLPGQVGNVAIFGHSSNNIFNPGQYKFAFVLLHELVPGDIFYISYNSKVYSYKVYAKQIVSPSNVSVLNPVEGKTATATLITCDPPGTSLNRLVVWGEQISPDPNANSASAPVVAPTTQQPTSITGNGPSLWERLTSWL